MERKTMIEKDKRYRVKSDHVGLCAAGTVVTPATDQTTKELVVGKTGKHQFNLTTGSLYFREDEVEAI
jgi:hypothetical protein